MRTAFDTEVDGGILPDGEPRCDGSFLVTDMDLGSSSCAPSEGIQSPGQNVRRAYFVANAGAWRIVTYGLGETCESVLHTSGIRFPPALCDGVLTHAASVTRTCCRICTRRKLASGRSVASAPVSRIIAIPPWAQTRRRLPRLLLGLVLCGVSFACIVDARLGLDPWNVLHEGIADRSGLDIGLVTTLLGVVILVGWIPLGERIGIGTVANALIIGTVVDLVQPYLPDGDALATRWVLLVAGLVLIGPAIGLYLGARLGPGPRDGIMTGIAHRGPSIRLARTAIELVALALGWLLGGTVGVGTVLFALTIGPNAQFWLGRLDLGHPPGFDPAVDPEVDPDPTVAAT